MQPDAPLCGRAREVLQAIVKAYIETGEPVGSRLISRRRSDGLSAASIRNVMADLADDGYLSQPHTSAGRVPTEKAFRLYVSALSAGRLPANEAERVRSELAGAGTILERVERSSHALVEITRNCGIAAAMPALDQELDQIELVPLADRRILMILATRDHMVRHRVVALAEEIHLDDLQSIRNYVNRNFSGWRLGDARRELLRRMAYERALYDEVRRKATLLYEAGMLQADSLPEICMEGASNLLGLDLHLTREKMRELLRALEEKERLIDLLDQFLQESSGELQVRIGLGDAHPAMKELALIGLSVSSPAGLAAKIAVLGPMRMHYERVMSAVLHIGHAFQDV
jgi:heat-inducible transcriptional repressor